MRLCPPPPPNPQHVQLKIRDGCIIFSRGGDSEEHLGKRTQIDSRYIRVHTRESLLLYSFLPVSIAFWKFRILRWWVKKPLTTSPGFRQMNRFTIVKAPFYFLKFQFLWLPIGFFSPYPLLYIGFFLSVPLYSLLKLLVLYEKLTTFNIPSDCHKSTQK